jgi:hypothetical protein
LFYVGQAKKAFLMSTLQLVAQASGMQAHASLRVSRTARNFKAETQPGDAQRKLEEKKTQLPQDKGGPESFVRSLRFAKDRDINI